MTHLLTLTVDTDLDNLPQLDQINSIVPCVKVAQVQRKCIRTFKIYQSAFNQNVKKLRRHSITRFDKSMQTDRQIDWEADIKQSIRNWKVNVTVSNGEKQSLSGLRGEPVGHDKGNFDQRHVDKVVNSDV